MLRGAGQPVLDGSCRDWSDAPQACTERGCAAAALRYGIGLTDHVKGQAAPDSAIVFGSTGASALAAKMREHQPGLLCFNGKRAAKEFVRTQTKTVDFGLQAATVGVKRLFVAPSTSAAANGAWDASYWFGLAKHVRSGGQ